MDKITTLTGTYRFYQQGKLLAACPNIVTTEGKRHIMRFLAGQVRTLGGSIALGAGTTAATVNDTRLTYEFDRATIYLTSPDYINNNIIFKGTIGINTIGSIYEVGLYSTNFGSLGAGSPSKSLATFERGYEAWSSDTFVSGGNARVGFDSLRLAPGTSATLSSVLPSVNLDLSGYLNSDDLSLAFFNLNTNTSTVKIRFRAADPAAYYEYTVTNPVAGYNVVTFDKSTLTKVGTLDFSVIDSIELLVTSKAAGASQVDFDGIRIETSTPDIDNVLVSHSVLGSPVVKTSLSEMDIEYALTVSL